MTLSITSQIQSPVEKVWQAYTTPSDIVQWNTASDDWETTTAIIELTVGGQFCYRMQAKDGSDGFDFAGKFDKVEPHRLLSYQLDKRQVTVDFVAMTDTQTEVTITFEPEPTNSLEQQRQGWQAILDNFKKYVENKP